MHREDLLWSTDLCFLLRPQNLSYLEESSSTLPSTHTTLPWLPISPMMPSGSNKEMRRNIPIGHGDIRDEKDDNFANKFTVKDSLECTNSYLLNYNRHQILTA